MAYEGDPLSDGNCPLLGNGRYANTDAWNDNIAVGITIVTGATPAGHAILRVRFDTSGGGRRSCWFHVTDPGLVYPRYIYGRTDFTRYITDNGKDELATIWLDPRGGKPRYLRARLEYYRKNRFFWGGMYHNCWSFAVEVAKHGDYETPHFGPRTAKLPTSLMRELEAAPQTCTVRRAGANDPAGANHA